MYSAVFDKEKDRNGPNKDDFRSLFVACILHFWVESGHTKKRRGNDRSLYVCQVIQMALNFWVGSGHVSGPVSQCLAIARKIIILAL